MSRAVLVIDVQRGLCEGEYQTFNAAGVIDRINEVTAKARAAGALVVIIQHESKDGVLVHGSRGWELAPQLQIGGRQQAELELRQEANGQLRVGVEVITAVVCPAVEVCGQRGRDPSPRITAMVLLIEPAPCVAILESRLKKISGRNRSVTLFGPASVGAPAGAIQAAIRPCISVGATDRWRGCARSRLKRRYATRVFARSTCPGAGRARIIRECCDITQESSSRIRCEPVAFARCSPAPAFTPRYRKFTFD